MKLTGKAFEVRFVGVVNAECYIKSRTQTAHRAPDKIKKSNIERSERHETSVNTN